MILYRLYYFIFNKLLLIFTRLIKYIITEKLNKYIEKNNFNVKIYIKDKHFLLKISKLSLNHSLINRESIPVYINKIFIREIDIFIPKNFYFFNNIKILIYSSKINISTKKNVLNKRFNQISDSIFILKSPYYFLNNKNQIPESIKLIENIIKYLYSHLNIHIKKINIKDQSLNFYSVMNCCISKNFEIYNCKIYDFKFFNLKYNTIYIPSFIINIYNNKKNIRIKKLILNIPSNHDYFKNITNIINLYYPEYSKEEIKYFVYIDNVIVNYEYIYTLNLVISNIKIESNKLFCNFAKLKLVIENMNIPILKLSEINIIFTEKIVLNIQRTVLYLYQNLINKIIPVIYDFYYIQNLIVKNVIEKKKDISYEKLTFQFIHILNSFDIFLLDLNLNNDEMKEQLSLLTKNKEGNHIKINTNNLIYQLKTYSNSKTKSTLVLDKLSVDSHLNKTLWKKFCISDKTKKCIKVKILTHVEKQKKKIYNILLEFGNFNLNIEEKCFTFLTEHVKSNIPYIMDISQKKTNIIIENFVMKSINITFSYKPEKINLQKFTNGDSKQVLKIGNVYDQKLFFPKIYLKNLKSFSELFNLIAKIMIDDIKNNKVFKYLKNIEPFNHFINIYSHCKHLVLDPMQNNGHNIFYRIGTSSVKFVKNMSYEFMDVSTKIISGTQTQLEKLSKHKVSNNVSKFHNSPENISDGIKHGYHCITNRCYMSNNEDLTLKSKIIQPIIGIAEMTNKTFIGIKNQIKPDTFQQMKDRYG